MDDGRLTPEELVAELRKALSAHFIRMSSLGVVSDTSALLYPCPRVSLGNCDVASASRLLDVVRSTVPRHLPQDSGAVLTRRLEELNAAVRRHLGE